MGIFGEYVGLCGNEVGCVQPLLIFGTWELGAIPTALAGHGVPLLPAPASPAVRQDVSMSVKLC